MYGFETDLSPWQIADFFFQMSPMVEAFDTYAYGKID